ncbi:MAG TPA: phage baseplate assembly protein V [Xylella sp.]
MMHDLLNAQKAAAQQATQGRASTRQGIVTSYDPNTYAVKVMLQPDHVLTGWIPLKSAWIGHGWGLFCPPSIGDAVEIDFQEDNPGVGRVGLRFFNDADHPLPCPSGEFWLVHTSGSRLTFHNDGSVELAAAAAITYTATQHHFVGPVQMDNTLNVNDNVTGGKHITATRDIAD